MNIINKIQSKLDEMWEKFNAQDAEYKRLTALLDTPAYSPTGDTTCTERRCDVNARLITLEWEFERMGRYEEDLLDLLAVCQRLTEVVPQPGFFFQGAALQAVA